MYRTVSGCGVGRGLEAASVVMQVVCEALDRVHLLGTMFEGKKVLDARHRPNYHRRCLGIWDQRW